MNSDDGSDNAKSKPSLSPQTLTSSLHRAFAAGRRYAALIFFLLLACVYGFVLLRINALSDVPASTSTSSDVTVAPTPHIDQSVVKQLESLQDHSVSVKALFDNARSNPFQE